MKGGGDLLPHMHEDDKSFLHKKKQKEAKITKYLNKKSMKTKEFDTPLTPLSWEKINNFPVRNGRFYKNYVLTCLLVAHVIYPFFQDFLYIF